MIIIDHRPGSKFNKLTMDRKISLLVSRGYKQAAFKSKSNAQKFASKWNKKGYGPAQIFRSTGPTVEDPNKACRAYYVVAASRKQKK